MILSLHCSPLLMLMFALPMRIVFANAQDKEEWRRWKNRRIEGWTSCSGKDSTHNGRRVKELGRSNKREHGSKNSIHSRRRVKEGGRLQSRIFFASSLSCFLPSQMQETNGLYMGYIAIYIYRYIAILHWDSDSIQISNVWKHFSALSDRFPKINV